MPAKKGATASKISKAELAGRAAQFATGLIGLGITSSAAIAGIISTSAKESQLDPTSGELGGQAWLNTLNKGPKQVNNKTISALQYVHLKLPQLGPGGRVATALGFPNGVPEDYIRNVISKGDEEWFKFIYPDGYKYRGRGFIQITGKASYQAVGNLIGIDLIKDPDLVTKDYDTAVKAAGAYTMIALGKGDPKKGLSILNSFTDEEEARKWIVANVAAGRTGFDIAIRNKVLSDPTGRSQLEKATENASLGSTAASEALNKLSTENADMRKSMAQGSGAPQVLQVNNNSTQKKVIQLPDNKPRELNPTMQ
jgi:hypothetical protein